MSIIAAIQMCSSDNIDDNLKIAAERIRAAAAKGAKIAVLPEMFAIMGKKPADALLAKEKYGNGKIQNFISTLALKLNIFIFS